MNADEALKLSKQGLKNNTERAISLLKTLIKNACHSGNISIVGYKNRIQKAFSDNPHHLLRYDKKELEEYFKNLGYRLIEGTIYWD